jgi:hypothetical protein
MAIAKARPTLIQKIVGAARRDPQKAGILTVLVAILVVLQIRLLLSSKPGTSLAEAATTPVPTGPDKSTGTLSAGGENGANPLRAWNAQDASLVDRNLFVVNLEKFPQDSGHVTAARVKSALFWDDLAKSLSLQADVRKERQVLVENLQQQASQIRLQSTLMGAVPKAVINGDLVGEGSVVACGTGDSRVTFRVLKIEARRIIIEREGIKLEIQMK